MKQINKLGFLIFLLSASCFSSPKPAACPSVAALKAVGVHQVETSLLGWQVASDKNNFNTKEVWRFVMLLIGDNSQSEAEAAAKANEKISSLILFSGPEENNHIWECDYVIPDGNDHFVGIAVTMPEDRN